MLRYLFLLLVLSISSIYAEEYNKESAFSLVYSGNINGDISAIGAPVLCAKKDGSNECDWNYDGYLFDITPKTLFDDHDSVFTKNSSSATLNLPSNVEGKDIKWAGLVWQGHIFGLGDQEAFENARAGYDHIILKDPQGGIHQIVADDTYYYGYSEQNVSVDGDIIHGYRFMYQGYKDITDIVRNSLDDEHKTFTVGNLNTTLIKDEYYIYDPNLKAFVKWGNWGGWSIVVVYNNPKESFKNISIYKGFKFLVPHFNNTESLTIDIDGFYTPKYGDISSKTVLFAAGAERKIETDTMEIQDKNGNWHKVSNDKNPYNNVINDTISYLGQDLNPVRDFNPGIDLDEFNTSTSLSNEQSSTKLRITMTAGNNNADQAFIGMLGMSIKLYQPEICYIEEFYDESGEKIDDSSYVSVGDKLTSHMIIRNEENETAQKVKITKLFSSDKILYDRNSTWIQNIDETNFTHMSDAFGDDLVDYNQSDKKMIMRLGRGANKNFGGNFQPNDTAYVHYSFVLNKSGKADFLYDNYYEYQIGGKNYVYKGPLKKCSDFNNTIVIYPQTGTFNIVEAGFDINGSDPVDPDASDYAKNFIQTKVVNKPFSMKALHLKHDNITFEDTQAVSFWEIVDSTNISGDPRSCFDAPVIYPASLRSSFAIDFAGDSARQFDLSIPTIFKNGRFRIRYMDWKKVFRNSGVKCENLSDMSSNLKGLPQCLNSKKKIKKVFPGTRCLKSSTGKPCKPSNHGKGSGIYDHEYGCIQCLVEDYGDKVCGRDNFAVRPAAFIAFGDNVLKRAGEEFNITLKAVDESNRTLSSGSIDSVASIPEYNESKEVLNIVDSAFTPDASVASQMLLNMQGESWVNGIEDITTCPHHGVFSALSNGQSSFNSGTITLSLKYSETGVKELNISEKPGFEYAHVDAKDTNDSNRFISAATNIIDKDDISQKDVLLFIPYSIEVIAGDYKSTTNENWAYIADSVNEALNSSTTPKMGGYITYHIAAKNKDGQITQNFTKTCYPDTGAPYVNGIKLNSTFDLFLDANISIDRNATLYFYTEDNTSQPIWTYHPEYNFTAGSNAIREWIDPGHFENGIGEAKIYFNINRDTTKAIPPVTIKVEDINTSTSWMSNEGATNVFRAYEINKTRIFYYARIHAPLYKTTKSLLPINLFIEVYDPSKTDPASIEGEESEDDIGWYVNTHHNSDNLGKIEQILHENRDILHTSNDFFQIIDAGPFARGRYPLLLKYKKTQRPYTAIFDINASKWLVYHRFEPSALYTPMEIIFEGEGRWKGIGRFKTQKEFNQSEIPFNRIEW